MNVFRCSTASLAMLLAMSAFAQQMPQPTKYHEALSREVGVWAATTKMYMEPGAEPMVSKGKETCQMLGGFWLTSKFEGEFLGQPFTGHSQVGYDAENGEYVSTWVDSMSPDLFVSRGKYDVKNHTLTLVGEGRDFQSGESKRMKMVTHYLDNDHKRFEMHEAAIGSNQWVKSMEIEYERAE